MNASEFRERLSAMTTEGKESFKKKAGAGYDDDTCIRMFIEGGPWERKFCDALGAETASDKAARANIASAWNSRMALLVAIVSLLVSLLALLKNWL